MVSRSPLESMNSVANYVTLPRKDKKDFKRAGEKYLFLRSSGFPFQLYFTRHRENLFTRAHISTAKMHFVYRLLLRPSPLSFLPFSPPSPPLKRGAHSQSHEHERRGKSETSTFGATAILSNPFNSILLILCSTSVDALFTSVSANAALKCLFSPPSISKLYR